MFHPEILCCSTPDFENLGAPIGSHNFCTAFIERKRKEANKLLSLLPKLCDPQSAIALLRVCASFCRLAHLARSIPPTTASLEAFAKHKLSSAIEKAGFLSLLDGASTVDMARLLAISAPQAHAWLRAQPSPKLGLDLLPNEVQALVKWWLHVFSCTYYN